MQYQCMVYSYCLWSNQGNPTGKSMSCWNTSQVDHLQPMAVVKKSLQLFLTIRIFFEHRAVTVSVASDAFKLGLRNSMKNRRKGDPGPGSEVETETGAASASTR